jgi:positive regulator of sigma E activity
MFTEPTRIIAADATKIFLQTERGNVCGKCTMKQGCGHSLLLSRSASTIELPREALLSDGAGADALLVGTSQQLCMSEQAVLSGVLWFYGVPLVSLLAATALATLLGAGEGITTVVGLSALALSFLWLKSYLAARKASWQPFLQAPSTNVTTTFDQ